MTIDSMGWFAFPSDNSDAILAAMDALRDMIEASLPENTMFELEMGDVEEPCLN